MSSSSGRILSRQIKPFNKKERECPPMTLVEAARDYLLRTEGIVRWESDVRAFNRTKTHRTVALKFVGKFDQADK